MSEIYTLKTERTVLTVSELTRNIRFSLEENFSSVWVEGEISNFKSHTSGHMYFSLKDEEAQLSVVMFRRENLSLKFEPKEGLKVMVYGRISVYPIRGQYQLYAETMEPEGVGALQLRFQQLKEKLMKEGLFDEARKKPLPFLPKRIAIVTSIDGAALHDILHVLNRRFSTSNILVAPVPVQGISAAPAIAEAISDLNAYGGIDVMIVGRGGGSLEDLWAFNEEIVARAIFASAIPVISAVGHEVDFTIADFVADLRAATPSAAAEIVLPVKNELQLGILTLKNRMDQSVRSEIRRLKEDLGALKQSRVLKDPLAVFEAVFQRLDELKKNLTFRFSNLISFKKEKIVSLISQLEALGPLEVLKRGFSVTLNDAGKAIGSYRLVRPGNRIKTKLREGFLISQVKETHA